MRKCIELIQTNQSFRKSVNLQLDMGNYERIGSYIPTRSSVAILDRYFAAVEGKTAENATILIGPYGKGKSHLLLVMLALLQGKSRYNDALLNKIEKCVGRDAASHIFQVTDSGVKYLTVLVNPVAGEALNQTFVAALREALVREQLEHIAPDSYYSEAVKVIANWKSDFPDTYHKLEELVKTQGNTPAAFIKKLEQRNKEALDYFVESYPFLTAGSTFAPMLQAGALKTYQQVGRVLTEEYGYAGIYVVFDEFSKYIEGHAEDGFSNDMRTLQDMCELANSSNTALFLTMVAHKSIHEYSKGIPMSAKNAFRGVEGRLTEVEFVVSAQNNYELIADAVLKKEPEFSIEYEEIKTQKFYQNVMEESWQLPCFQKLFSKEEFEDIVAKGCFPMTPLFSYALLHISERIAQNERTIFTFLAGDGQSSLAWLLARGQEQLIGIDKVYDYFKGLFRETADQPHIHNEWMKAEYALSQTEYEIERAVIKAIAVIRMIHREEEFPAKDVVIRLALAIEEEVCVQAIAKLKERNLITYRSSIGIYAFCNYVGVDVEKAIAKKTLEYENKDILCETLQSVLEMEYEIPKQYNQKYAMTRFFQYIFMRIEDFYKISSSEYLFEESFADGKMIAILPSETAEHTQLQEHLDALNDSRVLLLVTKQQVRVEHLAKKYRAVEALMKDEKFIDANKLLIQELTLYLEDIAFEINAVMEEAYLPKNQNVWILQANQEPIKSTSAAAFSNILSNICDSYYGFSPRVNHELVNVEHIGAQYLRARNTVITKILDEDDCSGYEQGTSPEAMVYRAAFVHTNGDIGCQRVYAEIDDYFRKCAGSRVSFKQLYDRLLGKDYGVRKGVIPLFLARKLADMEDTAVIYIGNREMAADCETLNKVNDQPERYELYLEQETAEKEQYLQRLEDLFCAERSGTCSKSGRVNGIVKCMQNWYRSLPQYAMVTTDFSDHDIEQIKVLRNSLKRAEINPRELIFDKFPEIFGEGDYLYAAEKLHQCKLLLDGKLEQLKADSAAMIKQEFGVSEASGLKAGLVDWYQEQSVSSKSYILSTVVSNFMKYLGTLNTNDEGDIVAKLSKILLDVYIEDWRDDTVEKFQSELSDVRMQVEAILDQNDADAKQSRIILTDAKGNEIAKYFDADTKDSTSIYLKNMMSEALEEFGDTLEMNQKVAVLVEMLEELLQ